MTNMTNKTKLLFIAIFYLFGCTTDDFENVQIDDFGKNDDTENVVANVKTAVEHPNSSNNTQKKANATDTFESKGSLVTSKTQATPTTSKGLGTKTTSSRNSFGFPQGGGCPNWTPRWWGRPLPSGAYDSEDAFDVYYNEAFVPLNQINCVRQSIFEANPNIYLVAKDPGNPYHDIWYVPYKNDTDKDGSASNVRQGIRPDPRVCARMPCN